MLKHNKSITVNFTNKPAAFGRLCVETVMRTRGIAPMTPAAFGRLCVETVSHTRGIAPMTAQPPSGGCVLKPTAPSALTEIQDQPPSGGCVLKRVDVASNLATIKPAAFGRLCVETYFWIINNAVAVTSRLRAAVC